MSLRILLIVTLTCLVYNNETLDILKVMPQAQVILQKFLHLVENNQMNVSVVTTRKQYWNNGQEQQVSDIALLLPPNQVVLTESQITDRVGEQWLSDLQSWTSQGSGIATYTMSHAEDGKIRELLIRSSERQVPSRATSLSYDKILIPEETGMAEEREDYEKIYNYVIPGADGQTQSVKVLAVKLNVTVLNSENIPVAQINQIKKIVPKFWMMMESDNLISEQLQQALNSRIPLTNSSWQVVIGTKSSIIPSVKWINLTVSSTNFLIFVLEA